MCIVYLAMHFSNSIVYSSYCIRVHIVKIRHNKFSQPHHEEQYKLYGTINFWFGTNRTTLGSLS